MNLWSLSLGTLGAWLGLRALKRRARGERRGLWIDLKGRHVVDVADETVAELRSLGINEVSIAVHDILELPFQWQSWSAQELRTFVSAASKAGITSTLKVWASPNAQHAAAFEREGFYRLAAELGCPVEYGVEEAWFRRDVDGFASRASAAFAITSAARRAGVRELSITTPPSTIDDAAPFAPLVDYIAVQAYSQRWPNGDGTYAESFNPGGRYAPGAIQALARRKAEEAGFRAVVSPRPSHRSG
jgi:hypothetical protein